MESLWRPFYVYQAMNRIVLLPPYLSYVAPICDVYSLSLLFYKRDPLVWIIHLLSINQNYSMYLWVVFLYFCVISYSLSCVCQLPSPPDKNLAASCLQPWMPKKTLDHPSFPSFSFNSSSLLVSPIYFLIPFRCFCRSLNSHNSRIWGDCHPGL